jgi:hypothetical protein
VPIRAVLAGGVAVGVLGGVDAVVVDGLVVSAELGRRPENTVAIVLPLEIVLVVGDDEHAVVGLAPSYARVGL